MNSNNAVWNVWGIHVAAFTTRIEAQQGIKFYGVTTLPELVFNLSAGSSFAIGSLPG